MRKSQSGRESSPVGGSGFMASSLPAGRVATETAESPNDVNRAADEKKTQNKHQDGATVPLAMDKSRAHEGSFGSAWGGNERVGERGPGTGERERPRFSLHV
jgi:hypothetical protein